MWGCMGFLQAIARFIYIYCDGRALYVPYCCVLVRVNFGREKVNCPAFKGSGGMRMYTMKPAW